MKNKTDHLLSDYRKHHRPGTIPVGAGVETGMKDQMWQDAALRRKAKLAEAIAMKNDLQHWNAGRVKNCSFHFLKMKERFEMLAREELLRRMNIGRLEP